MKLQQQILLLVSILALSVTGAYAQTSNGDPTPPKIVVGKGTIGIVCRSAEGKIQSVRPVERPDSFPDGVIFEIEADWHVKYPDVTNGILNGGECTLQHISQDDVDALDAPAPAEAPANSQ